MFSCFLNFVSFSLSCYLFFLFKHNMNNPNKKSPNLSHLDHSAEENVVNSNNKRLRIKSHEGKIIYCVS